MAAGLAAYRGAAAFSARPLVERTLKSPDKISGVAFRLHRKAPPPPEVHHARPISEIDTPFPDLDKHKLLAHFSSPPISIL